jgi:hypothetical protein
VWLIVSYLASLLRANPAPEQPSASTTGPILRAQSADGVIHEFPAETSQAIIDRVMKDYAISHQSPPSAQSVDDNTKRETEALTKVYPNWRDIVGAVDSPEKSDPNNKFRKWLSTQPAAYAAKVTSTHSPSVLAKAINEFQADQAKAAASPPPAAP